MTSSQNAGGHASKIFKNVHGSHSLKYNVLICGIQNACSKESILKC